MLALKAVPCYQPPHGYTALSFSSLPLQPSLSKNLTELGYEQATEIQALCLPEILRKKDVIAKAKTGSGKTLAFGIGILHHLEVKKFRVQTLVLCPTRELADQVARELRKLARLIHNIKILTLCGGTPMGPQIGSLEHGAHIIVGTPGRVDDHRRKGRLRLDQLTSLVLDEADRMLDMGFRDTLEDIISATPDTRQTLLFSATYPSEIEQLAEQFLRQPSFFSATEKHSTQTIKQSFYRINPEQKFDALLRILHAKRAKSSIIFCHTKKDTQEVSELLFEHGLAAIALHGDMDQRERDRSLVRFANQSATILVATDVAARGLDIESVALVVNFHIAKDADVHTHRIGRTGRSGNFGEAVSFFTDREERKLEYLNQELNIELDELKLPPSSVLKDRLDDAPMRTLQIDGGKKQKLRPGDLVGALTGDGGLSADELGKITVFPLTCFIAVKRERAKKALEKLNSNTIKGRHFKARLVRR